MTPIKITVNPSVGGPLSNTILRRLPREVFSSLLPDMRSVALHLGHTLYEVRDDIGYLYFPERGCMLSLLAGGEDGGGIEIGVTGCEGFAGVTAILGNQVASHRILVQLGGSATRIKASAVRRGFAENEQMRNLLLGYLNTLFAQISQTALCNRVHTVEERLARWVLVTADRAPVHGELPLTHEFLARMLGVNRSTLSLTASMFQQASFIAYRRGKLKIVDRDGLEGVACSCYGIVKEYVDDFVGK
jgi:CRP-like cAMP-binding protein